MRRILLILILVGLTATVGCRICAHPFDYCGPTYVGECSDVCCNPDARAGSVLSPPLHSTCTSQTPGDETILEPIPMDTAMTASPRAKADKVVPLSPSARTARAGGPTFLR